MIVLCAANRYDGIALADWHLANQLAKLTPVLYVDPPMSPLTPLRQDGASAALAGPRLRLVRPGLARLTPVVQPFPSRPVTAALTSGITRQYLRWATTRLGGRVRAVLTAWPQYPVFRSCGEEVAVYWAQDDFVGGAALFGVSPGLLGKQERRVAGAADLVVAASPVVAATWRDRGLDPLLVPYGTDPDAYRNVDVAPLPPDADLPGPVAGFVGHINGRSDLSLLEAVADRGHSLLLVGPHDPAFEPARFGALTGRPNVRWTGSKPFAALPGYLRVVDVGLVPYQDSAFNRGSFPLKTLEYLAAGRAVVGTDLPAIRWLKTDLVTIARGPAAFAQEVAAALARPRTQAVAAARRQFAARHSWACRAADINAAISAKCRQKLLIQ